MTDFNQIKHDLNFPWKEKELYVWIKIKVNTEHLPQRIYLIFYWLLDKYKECLDIYHIVYHNINCITSKSLLFKDHKARASFYYTQT